MESVEAVGRVLYAACLGNELEQGATVGKMTDTHLKGYLAVLEAGQETIRREIERRKRDQQRKKLRVIK